MRKHISSIQLLRIGDALKQARLELGLTQRALGERVRLPQSHISKIEQGGVDLQLSSLTELARALELEVQLVPRHALPAVEGVVRSVTPSALDRSTSQAHVQIAALIKLADKFDPIYPDAPEIGYYRQSIDGLIRQRFDPASLGQLQTIVAAARKLARPPYLGNGRQFSEGLNAVTSKLRELRDALAHRPADAQTRQLPAHSLGDDEDD
jgi:transcriptional regulator with XRE-family HTH domain